MQTQAMKTIRYFAVLAFCLAPSAMAQDAEPFDPYKAYRQGDVQPPKPAETKPADTPVQPDLTGDQPPAPANPDMMPQPDIAVEPEAEPTSEAPPKSAPEAAPKLRPRSSGSVIFTPNHDAADADAPGTELAQEPQAEKDEKSQITPESPGNLDRNASEISTPPEEPVDMSPEVMDYIGSDQNFRDKDARALPDISTPIAVISPEDIDTAPQIKGAALPALKDFPVAPFYLTAEEYLTLRGDIDAPQLVLRYDVSSKRLDGSDIQISSQATLILSYDFAAISHVRPGDPEKLRIYDFKMDRHLTVEQQTDRTQFSNQSLFASAHRNTRLVAMMTNKGARDVIDFGNGTSLPAFWMESAIGFSAKSRKGDIQITERNGVIKALYKDQDAAQIELSMQPFPNDDMSNVQLVFAHQYWPVHPTILERIFGAAAPIEKLTYVSRGPDDTAGTQYSWTLSSRDTVTASFPLPRKAVNIAQRDGAPALAKSLRKTLTQPAPDLAAMSEPFRYADTPMQAWQNAQRYMTYSGKCISKSPPALCDDIAGMADDDTLDAALRKLITAANQAQNPKTRSKALPALVEAAQKDGADPATLYLAGITRARMKTADVPKSAAKFDAEAALTTAVNADPHNPSYLMGLAQIYAAADRFEEAWDIYDTLKVVLSQPQMDGHAIKLPIDRVENGLRTLAPAYFLPRG